MTDETSDIGEDLQILKITRQGAGNGTRGTVAGHRFEALVFPKHAEMPEWELGAEPDLEAFDHQVHEGRALPGPTPNTTLLRNLSLPGKESERGTLDFMRFREISLLVDGRQKDKVSASRTNQSSLSQPKLLTRGFYFPNAHENEVVVNCKEMSADAKMGCLEPCRGPG